MSFQRETRYFVIKVADAVEALSQKGFEDLTDILYEVNRHRALRDKDSLKCVVVEDDWPEYDVVWKMIEDRVANSTL
jgi:hypothetical protein